MLPLATMRFPTRARPFQDAHPIAQAFDARLHLEHVPGVYPAAIAHALDARERRSAGPCHSGLARIRMAPTCATTSVRMVGGSAGRPFPEVVDR